MKILLTSVFRPMGPKYGDAAAVQRRPRQLVTAIALICIWGVHPMANRLAGMLLCHC
jgi:hypothetical protein